MTRLPIPGQDDGTWGNILNDFLSVEHNADGTLKASGSLAIKEPSIPAGTMSQYWRGDKTFQTLDKTAVGLANVDNTSDATKNSATATVTNKTISGASNTLSSIPESAVTNLTTDLANRVPKQPWQFFVEDYGAAGDGVTNDTVAIRNATNAAFTFAQSDPAHYAEVRFKAAVYLCSSATVQGGATKGNAQIPIPVIAGTVAKPTVAFVGYGASALPHWLQTSGQKSGTILKTTATGTNDGTFGPASVIGGPTREQGYGFAGGAAVFTNTCIVIDGISIVSSTTNPTMSGFDFVGVAEAVVKDASVFCDAGTPTVSTTNITNQWTFGLRMPDSANNALSDIGRFSVEGYCYGLVGSEHTVVHSMRAVYCIAGLVWDHCSPHQGIVNHATIEWCQVAVNFINGYSSYVDIKCIDWEQAGNATFAQFYVINDSGNKGIGTIGLNGNTGFNIINGGGALSVKDLGAHTGSTSAPTMPASTVNYTNVLYRDAAVTITGGTVSAITIDGAVTGLTSGCVIVPSGRTISITYTAAPTWVWYLL